jgi:Skp family chaperone for outer membrane proteins
MNSDSPSDTTGGAPSGGGEELSGSLFLGDWSTPGSEVPGFGIESPTSVAQAAETLTGAPVTIEHTGTYEAAADLDRRDGDVSGASMHAYLTGSADPARRPVGTVLYAEGTKALIRIKPEAQRVSQLIESGMLDLSLTHLESSGERGSEVKSLELSLVTKPARAGARVLQQYKGTPIVGLKQKIVMSSAAAEAAAPAVPMETSTETPAPVNSDTVVAATPATGAEPAAADAQPLVDAFAALPEEHREAIKAKVFGLQQSLEEMTAAKKASEEEAARHKKLVEDYQEDATREKELFKQRVDMLASELAERHPAAAAMVTATHGIAAHGGPAAQLVADRMVRACSEILAGQAQPLAGRKRARAEAAPVVERAPPAAAAAPAAPAAPTHMSAGDERLRNFLTSMDRF